nr:MAG TPA: leucine-rich repeat protein [Caudoviricetes sp.]
MADIVLYDEAGEPVTYNNVETLTTDTPTEGETVTFTLGEVMDGLEVELNLADGDQTVTVPEGKLLKDLTIKKPDTLLAKNIASNVAIAGVKGTIKKAPYEIVSGYGGEYEVTDEMFTSYPPLVKSNAFANTEITRVELEVAYSVGAYAFQSCRKLVSASFPNCQYISSRAFWSCPSLTDIYFPHCLSIGSEAFASYASSAGSPISEAIFPECKEIGYQAFKGCTKLAKLSFPKCTTIQTGAFSGYNGQYYINNTSLKSAYFPECTLIYSNAFNGCRALETASFPKLRVLSTFAFAFCSYLMSLYLLGESVVTMQSTMTFYGTPISSASQYTKAYGSVFVRASLLSAYLTATYWSAYSSRIVGLTDEEIEALDGGATE